MLVGNVFFFSRHIFRLDAYFFSPLDADFFFRSSFLLNKCVIKKRERLEMGFHVRADGYFAQLETTFTRNEMRACVYWMTKRIQENPTLKLFFFKFLF